MKITTQQRIVIVFLLCVITGQGLLWFKQVEATVIAIELGRVQVASGQVIGHPVENPDGTTEWYFTLSLDGIKELRTR